MIDHLTAFELECKGKNLRPKTLAFYTWELGKFLAWLQTHDINKIELNCEAEVPGIDQAKFDEVAAEAKANCPVSKALAAVDEIVLNAKLVG